MRRARKGDQVYVVSVWTDAEGLDHGKVFSSKRRAESYAARVRREAQGQGAFPGDGSVYVVWVLQTVVR